LDPRLAYWSTAWLLLLATVAVATAALRSAQRGDTAQHRQRMRAAAALVALFVLSYPIKLLWLGREPLASWEPRFVWVLRAHELCIAFMLLGGVTALVLAHRLRLAEPQHAGGPATAAGLRLHRRAGWLGFVGALCALATAAYVLYGMFQR
jgi:uncharacterized membrane protein YozB (DUF420 family)